MYSGGAESLEIASIKQSTGGLLLYIIWETLRLWRLEEIGLHLRFKLYQLLFLLFIIPSSFGNDLLLALGYRSKYRSPSILASRYLAKCRSGGINDPKV